MRALAVAVVATVVVACGAPVKPPPAAPVAVANEPPAATDTADGWLPYTSADGGFTLKFPGTPTESSQDIATGVVVHVLTLRADNGLYLLTWSVQSPTESKDPKVAIDSAQAGLLDGAAGATVLDQNDITLDGTYPGRALTVRLAQSDATVFVRTYVARGRFFQMSAVGAGDGTTVDRDTFFGSFALTK